MKGNMQLFSVDQQRSQALEAHAASFAQFKVRVFFFSFSSCTFDVLFDCYFTLSFLFIYLFYLISFLETRTLLLLYPLPQRHLTLDRSLLSYMSLNLVPSQVRLLLSCFVVFLD